MDINAMMRQAKDMQSRISSAQKKLEEEETGGTSGGGLVKVIINGRGIVKSIKIDPSLVNKEEIEMLEDLLIAAINNAKEGSDNKSNDVMAGIAAEFQLPPGFKLPF